MGLEKKLQNLIREKGCISYDELIVFCRQERKKIETATRKLRKSISPMIEPIIGRKKSGGTAIVAYKWVGRLDDGITPLKTPNLKPDDISTRGIDIFQLKDVLEAKKRQEFINNERR